MNHTGHVHYIQCKITFINPVDYFDVVLQKQIDLRMKFKINENDVIVSELNDDKRFIDSEFIKNHRILFEVIGYFGISYLLLNNSPNKYKYYREIFDKIKNMIYMGGVDIVFEEFDEDMCYEEFEYKMDIMLDQFNLFLNKFELSEDEKKIIEAFELDENLKSNIKSICWKDFFIKKD
jgi:hypothetical protein